jgi:DNA-binding transcriptional LysR family regulator
MLDTHHAEDGHMLRYLRTFLIAAETASFSAAGERLGLTQSAVSLQMRRLEEDLGCQLFERTGKSVTLGPEGRRIMADAARMLALYEGMRGQPDGAVEPAKLDVGAISTAQATLLPRALQQFRQHHPAIHINIVPGMSVQLLSQVDTQELDLAVMIRPRLGMPADLKWLTVMRERYVGIAPPGMPGDLKTLPARLPFIRYNRHSHGGQLVDQFLRTHRIWVREGMELDEPAVILQMVREGLGWAVVPGDLIQATADDSVSHFALPGRALMREVGVLVRRPALQRPAIAMLVECLRERASQLAG